MDTENRESIGGGPFSAIMEKLKKTYIQQSWKWPKNA
jgi:hypothetical protein